jgi:hypothetical protein
MLFSFRRMDMDISESFVEFYLSKVSNMWIIDNGIPPDDPSKYNDYYIEDVKNSAIGRDELDILKLALEYILSNPEIDTGWLADSEYEWEDSEARDLIQHIWKKIWPNTPPESTETLSEIRLVKVPLNEWRKKRDLSQSSD